MDTLTAAKVVAGIVLSSRQRHYFLDSICSVLITRELRGPKMAGCSFLEFSFVSSESGA